MRNQTANFIVFLSVVKENLDTELERCLDNDNYMPMILSVFFGILIGLGILVWIHS